MDAKAGSPLPGKLREPARVRVGRDIHVNVVLLANRANQQMDEICQHHGLSQAQYIALWVLCLDETADGLPMSAIADGLLNRASDVTRLVDRMVKAGLVERLPNPHDRRGVLVRPTRAGRHLFEQATPDLQELHRTEWSNLTVEEIDTLDALLARALWG